MQSEAPLQTRIRGCLLGGAIGDALGAPVEFMSVAEIRRDFGPDGIRDYAKAYGRRGAITDDTQMTLFTAEGLLRAFVRETLKGISVPAASVVCHAYLRWLRTQGTSARDVPEIGTDGWLWNVPELHSRRAPGNTCLSALAAMTGFTDERAQNDSKEAGGIMRIAPVGLALGREGPGHASDVFDLAMQVSWITHGHPSGYLSAAAFAVMIHGVLHGQSLAQAIDRARAAGRAARQPRDARQDRSGAHARWQGHATRRSPARDRGGLGG